MKEGDTFWLHVCKHDGYPRKRYIPVGKTCKICEWYELPATERAKIGPRQKHKEYKDDY